MRFLKKRPKKNKKEQAPIQPERSKDPNQVINMNDAGSDISIDDLKDKTILHSRLKVGAHKGIEVYTIALASCVALFLGGYGVSWVQGYGYETKQAELTTPIGNKNNSESLSFSKDTNATVTLQPLVRTKDNHVCYVPFSISNMNKLSYEANDYRLYITPTIKYHSIQHFKASLIMFGSTGNAVIKLESSQPIEANTVQVALISNKNLKAGEENTEDNDVNQNDGGANTMQKLESKYNMLTFTTNPGAQKNVRSTRLPDGATWKQVYNACFADAQRSQYKSDIQHQKKLIVQYKKTANNFRGRLEQLGYDVPKNPDFWNDDWRPYNAVNTDTGMMKNGMQATAALANNSNEQQGNEQDSPDAKQLNSMPTYLNNKRLGKNAMQTADAQIQAGNNQGNNGDGNNNNDAAQQATNNSDPLTMWNTLKGQWQNILECKQQIYVYDNYGLYKINNSVKQDALSGVSVQSQKHVKVKTRAGGL